MALMIIQAVDRERERKEKLEQHLLSFKGRLSGFNMIDCPVCNRHNKLAVNITVESAQALCEFCGISTLVQYQDDKE